MAHIDYREGLFLGVGDYDDRTLFKEAGFRWNPELRLWATRQQSVAEAVKGLTWTRRAIRQVEKRAEIAAISHEMSYQAQTDFDPPIPQDLLDKGWDYKPFQKGGIEYATLRRDTLIADQPGLGKTIQAIGVSNCFPKSIRRVLVIAPASLKEMWRRTWLQWCAKGLSVGIAETSHIEKVEDGVYKSGKKKGQTKYRNVKHATWWPDTDVVVINYDILEKFAEEIRSVQWDMLVCDECHALKSSESGRTLFVLGDDGLEPNVKRRIRRKKGVKWFNAIDAKRRVFLSGTPMLNRPIEMWPIIKAFDPDGLGRDFKEFGYTYCDGWFDPARGKNGAYDFTGKSNGRELGQRLRETFMVRRLKREVLPELPPVFRQIVVLDSPEIKELVAREDELAQALKLYENTFVKGETDEMRDARLGEEIAANALKFGFDKARMEPDRPNARLLDIPYAAAVLGLEPPAVEVLFEEIALIRRELGIAKLSAVIPWVKNFLDGGEKLILFGYHSEVVTKIAEACGDYDPAVIYGGTPVKKRQAEVDRFQEDERCRLFCGNIQAAGVGYTMTRAADVAFAEGDWVPAYLSQAEDRACRIGQTAEKIMSFYLVANGSLDSRIAQSAKEKEDQIMEILDT